MYASGSKFESFKKVASDMGVLSTPIPVGSGGVKLGATRSLQLASFHSVSKGYLGE